MHRFGADLRWVFPGGPEVEPLPDGGWRDPCGFILSPAGAFNTFVDESEPSSGRFQRAVYPPSTSSTLPVT